MNDAQGHQKSDKNPSDLFVNLFVLELANNHWGSVERGREIIRQHGKVVQECGVKAAVKFQFRDVDSFVHDAFKPKESIEKEGEVVQAPGSSSRYIKKTIATKLTPVEFAELLKEVRAHGMLTMATPFDEKSVEWCRDLDIDIVKIASQDAKSWVLVERIADLGKPTIISNGGTDIADLDRVVDLFEKKGVPLAINHCVSMYPSEDDELELNQVDYLLKRYPNHVIGYSTHEYNDWSSSVQITHAKGARTWERHVDIEDAEGTPVSKYCSLPGQVRVWFEAFNKAKEMMGGSSGEFRLISEKEREYVQSVSRGAYALKDLEIGSTISKSRVGKDFEFVIPLQGSQLSSRDLDEELVLKEPIKKGDPILLSYTTGKSRSPFSMSKSALAWAVGDGLVRTAWVGVLVLLATFADLWASGVWALVITGVFGMFAGLVLTMRNRYELYPGILRAMGSVLIGFLAAGLIMSIVGIVHVGGPMYLPWLMLASGMVVTALVSRISMVFAKPFLRHSISLVLLAAALFLLAYVVGSLPAWLILGYILVGIAFIDQVVIKICRTGVLLPWVQLFWSGVGVLIFAAILIVWLSMSSSVFVMSLFNSSMSVGLLAAVAGTLFVLSILTRIKMRMARGDLMLKRGIAMGILCVAGVSVAAVSVPLVLTISTLLVSSLFLGDRSA